MFQLDHSFQAKKKLFEGNGSGKKNAVCFISESENQKAIRFFNSKRCGAVHAFCGDSMGNLRTFFWRYHTRMGKWTATNGLATCIIYEASHFKSGSGHINRHPAPPGMYETL